MTSQQIEVISDPVARISLTELEEKCYGPTELDDKKQTRLAGAKLLKAPMSTLEDQKNMTECEEHLDI